MYPADIWTMLFLENWLHVKGVSKAHGRCSADEDIIFRYY
jgi:hypothetical protein